MSRRATIADVARASGVSPGAVSRILRNDETIKVRDETKQKVMQAMKDLSYSPNPHARGLRMARSGTIAMIVPEINSPAFLPIIYGAQKAARDRGYLMILGGLGEEGEDPQLASRMLASNHVDGFLISTGRNEAEQLAAARELEVPSVLVNRYLDAQHPHVVLDDLRGAMAVTEYLLSLGHRRIAFVGGLSRFLGGRRVAGYKLALELASIAFDPALAVESGYDRQGGEAALHTLMAAGDPPTAIFATNHLVAAGLLVGAQKRGLRVPQDLSIASFYDGPIAELLNPALTAVAFPLDKLGYESTQMLVDLIEGIELRTRSVTIAHDKIVSRGSTSALNQQSSAAFHRLT
ncbi:LacI family DNA-binding transcriptional regulator [Variovorax sp. 770b2]|uniref:LacI family DNA-binding transcriptional regulator n=1 Tax=Variovorax sp. 770b2 TaxID=1566271 RepID=UPI0008E0D9A5|nr:LacI family DNA-binding transcriptional regulator [Variovorax sp. 770b2]SFQ33578.1 transcriptional regulator, LacI family [Variovorax sp. 770b2]